jgi:DNA-binding response OmpR family regulator
MIRKIVVLDDDRVTLRMLEEVLSQENVQIFTARDGDEGYKLILKETPDIVISDLLMPNVDGFDLCRKIKKEPQLANTKIIIMSAVYKGYYHKSEIRESGADDFILKPIDTDDLKNKVAKFLLES